MRHDNHSAIDILGAFGAGMAAMYVLDPDRGRRRRSLLRDKVARSLHKAEDAAGATGRDLRNRTRGLVAEARSRLRRDDPDDWRLVERVRAELGRVASHPSAITATAENGRVTLSGAVPAHELDSVLSAVRKVRGVAEARNELDVYQERDGIPSLHGGGPRRGPTRLLAGGAGAALFLLAVRRRDALASGIGVAGAVLLARALTNVELKRLTGVGGGRRAVDVQKIINIAAPVDRVYEFWSRYENFPHFMSHVREVRDHGGGRSHWVVDGPAGVPIEWEAVVNEQIPNEVLAWRTVPGSAVEHAGIVRFQQNPDGSTRVDVSLSYNPPAGAIGHGLAVLLGNDPKRQLDDDLVRVKTALETGRPPRDAAVAGAGPQTPGGIGRES